MGFTPNAGVIMGTVREDLDLGALLYICEKEGLNAAQANDLVNKQSGLQEYLKFLPIVVTYRLQLNPETTRLASPLIFLLMT